MERTGQQTPPLSRSSSPASSRPSRPTNANTADNAPADRAAAATVARSQNQAFEPTLAETQSNLLLASSALEAAFTRLQNIRSTLRELDMQGMAHTEGETTPRITVGPSHAAIVLSNGEPEHARRDTHMGTEVGVSSSIQSMLRIIRSSISAASGLFDRENEDRDAVSHDGDHASMSSTVDSPAHPPPRRRLVSVGAGMGQMRPLQRRRSLLEMHLRRNLSRSEPADEASTSLGRQVAARAAAGRTRSSTTDISSPSPSARLASIASRLSDSMRRLDLEVLSDDEEERAIVAPNVNTPAGRRSLPRPHVIIMPRGDALSTGSDSESSATTVEVPSSARPFEVTLSSAQDQQSQINMRRRNRISNISWSRARDEYPGLADGGGNGGHADVYSDIIEVDPSESRSYRVRRRLNADGDEHVHRIRVDDWDMDEDDPNDWLLPRERPRSTSSIRLRRTLDSVLANHRWAPGERPRPGRSSAPSGREAPPTLQPIVADSTHSSSRRRRGWARLNADGDEIPTEEEEELERSRMERRARGTDRAIADSGELRRRRLEYLVPTTRAAFPYGTDDEMGAAFGRVRLNLPTVYRQYGGADAPPLRDGEDDEAASQPYGTDIPYYVDPLPMPLIEMGPKPSSYSSHPHTHRLLRLAEPAAR